MSDNTNDVVRAKAEEIGVRMAECGKRAESATDDTERAAILHEGISYLATEAITCFAFAVALGQRVQEQAAMLDDLQAQLALSRPASFV